MTIAIEKELQELGTAVEKGSRVLDVGCGNRPYQKFFGHCEYLGIDVEMSGRKLTDKEADLFYDGENIPFPDGHFNVVVCTQVFEHCLNPGKLVREIHRVLKPNGMFFFSVPFLWGEHEVPYDFRRFTSFGSKKFLEENGFLVEKQIRAEVGLSAIRTMVSSEINHCRVHNLSVPGFPSILIPFMDKLAWKLFSYSMRIWSKRFPFPRLYLDNILVSRKP